MKFEEPKGYVFVDFERKRAFLFYSEEDFIDTYEKEMPKNFEESFFFWEEKQQSPVRFNFSVLTNPNFYNEKSFVIDVNESRTINYQEFLQKIA